METPSPRKPTPAHRQQVLLSREVLACEDPVCCCEAEPRWLRFQQQQADRPDPTEWESLDRSPSDEL